MTCSKKEKGNFWYVVSEKCTTLVLQRTKKCQCGSIILNKGL